MGSEEKVQIKHKSHNAGLDRCFSGMTLCFEVYQCSLYFGILCYMYMFNFHEVLMKGGYRVLIHYHLKSAGLTECGISLTFSKLAADMTVTLCALIHIKC